MTCDLFLECRRELEMELDGDSSNVPNAAAGVALQVIATEALMKNNYGVGSSLLKTVILRPTVSYSYCTDLCPRAVGGVGSVKGLLA